MIEVILKVLDEHSMAIAVIIIGLVRELRLWHKHLLDHEIEILKNNK